MSILMRVVLRFILHLALQKKGFLLTCKYMRNSKEKDIIFHICLDFKFRLLVCGDIYQIKILKNRKKKSDVRFVKAYISFGYRVLC